MRMPRITGLRGLQSPADIADDLPQGVHGLCIFCRYFDVVEALKTGDETVKAHTIDFAQLKIILQIVIGVYAGYINGNVCRQCGPDIGRQPRLAAFEVTPGEGFVIERFTTGYGATRFFSEWQVRNKQNQHERREQY